MLNTYHSSHLSHPISPIEQWKIYSNVIYYIVKCISTISWICFSLSVCFTAVWEVGTSVKRQQCNVILHISAFNEMFIASLLMTNHRVEVQIGSQALYCIYPESNRVSVLDVLWNAVIWIQLCPCLFCVLAYLIYIWQKSSLLFSVTTLKIL